MSRLSAAVAVCGLVLSSQAIFAQQRGGQPPAGGQGNAQLPQGRQNVPPNMFGQLNQNPWFANSAIRSQLNLNNDQYTQLNQAYTKQYAAYQQSVAPYNNVNNLTDAQRQAIIRSQNQFYSDFDRTTSSFISPEQQARLQRMGRHYRGYANFNDPAFVERLNLTQDQIAKLQGFEQQYNTQLSTYYQTRQTNPDTDSRRFSALRREMYSQMTSVLTPDQLKVWKELMGDPYNFVIE